MIGDDMDRISASLLPPIRRAIGPEFVDAVGKYWDAEHHAQ
jgi:hypothetical protein